MSHIISYTFKFVQMKDVNIRCYICTKRSDLILQSRLVISAHGLIGEHKGAAAAPESPSVNVPTIETLPRPLPLPFFRKQLSGRLP